MKIDYLILLLAMSFHVTAQEYYNHQEFCMGADLSYVNQIEDKGAVWRENGTSVDPYELFAKHGGNCARFRIWYNPEWTKQVYIDNGREATQLYNDYYDVKKAIQRSKENGLAVCLDFHYSDTWAAPGNQELPEAWKNLTFDQIKDSIYAYTFRVLTELDKEDLMPEYVQIGNEINSGLLFPYGRLSNSKSNLAILLNQAIKAVKDAGSQSEIMPKIIIHIAQPENVSWWFNQMIPAGVNGFDIIGFSYYPRWSDIPLSEISDYVSDWKIKFGKDVMCVETSYLWKIYGATPSQDEIIQMEPNYYPSVSGQKKFFIDLTKEIIDGGGKGIMPWEPFWVKGQEMINASGNVGANWEQRSFFDYSKGNEVNASIDYMNYPFDGISGNFVVNDSVNIDIKLHVKESEIQGADFFIEGSFTDNIKVKLEKSMDTIYSYSVRLPKNTFQVYRFYRETQPEIVPEIYRVGNATDRAFSVPSKNTTFNLKWQDDYSTTDSVKITFRVNMQGYTVDEGGIYIYGNFYGNWGPRIKMENLKMNLYSKTLTLKANSEVYFRFFNGYDWSNTELIPTSCRYGDYNRIFFVPDFNASYDFDYNVCGQVLCDTCSQVTSASQIQSLKKYVIFVNESNQIVARFPNDVTRIVITDLWGRKLSEQQIDDIDNICLSHSNWPSGIYIMSFVTNEKSLVTKKFVLNN